MGTIRQVRELTDEERGVGADIVMRKTKYWYMQDFIDHSSIIIEHKNEKYIVGYYCNRFTAIKQSDFLAAKDKEIIPEYIPDGIFTKKELEKFEM